MSKLNPIPETTKSEAFQRWFAGSWFKDDDGKPLVLYHGTRPDNEIEAFELPNEMDGIYFTPDPLYAEGFVNELFSDEQKAGGIYPVYLSIKNPYIVIAEEGDEDWESFVYRGLNRKELQAQGYDGAILIEKDTGVVDQVQAYDPTQIKSAIGNSGTFDPTIPDIRFARTDPRYLFAGPQAESSDLQLLDRARQLEKKKQSSQTIWRETGWLRGVDGNWRYEIDDSQVRLTIGIPQAFEDDVFSRVYQGVEFTPENKLIKASYREGKPDCMAAYGHTQADAGVNLVRHMVKREFKGIVSVQDIDGQIVELGDILDHPRLYAAYPRLKEQAVRFDRSMAELDWGEFDWGTGITLNGNLSHGQILDVLLHEVQHALQEAEGFAYGGMPKQRFTDRVKDRLKELSTEQNRKVSEWTYEHRDLLDAEHSTADMLTYAMMYQSMRRLMSYANREKPSGVLRLIRNEMGWVYEDKVRQSESCKAFDDLQREWFNLPKRHKMQARNRWLREHCAYAADLISEVIPLPLLKQFREDQRQVKSILNSLEKAVSRAREKTQPLEELKKAQSTTEALKERHHFSSTYEVYRALAGEIEARNTETRRTLTEQERRDTHPERTADISSDDAIVIFRNNKSFNVEVPFRVRNTVPANFLRERQSTANGLSKLDAQIISDSLMRGWTNRPDIVAVNRISDLPSKLQGDIWKHRAAHDMRAAFWNNTVYVVAPRLPGRHALEEVVLHEVIGHYGLRNMLAEQLEPTLERIFVDTDGTPLADQVKAAYFKDPPFNEQLPEHRQLLAEELMAKLAESAAHQKLSDTQRYMSEVRQGLRDMGFQLPLTHNDLLNLLHGAEQVVKTGGVDRPGEFDTCFRRAFHGSPHRFDRFSLDAFGSGEGSAAFGWGLYFAGKREVADFYREQLSQGTLYKGERITNTFDAAQGAVLSITDLMRNGDIDDAELAKGAVIRKHTKQIEYLESMSAEVMADPDPRAIEILESEIRMWRDKIEAVQAINPSDIERTTGSLYEVDIPDDDELLNLDHRYSQQPPAVREKVNAALVDRGLPLADDGTPLFLNSDPTGEAIYASVCGLQGDRAGSLLLGKHGIPGLRYLDRFSRTAANEPTFNYVIWDEEVVSVQVINGEATQARFSRMAQPSGPQVILDTLDNETLSMWLNEQYGTDTKGMGRDAMEALAEENGLPKRVNRDLVEDIDQAVELHDRSQQDLLMFASVIERAVSQGAYGYNEAGAQKVLNKAGVARAMKEPARYPPINDARNPTDEERFLSFVNQELAYQQSELAFYQAESDQFSGKFRVRRLIQKAEREIAELQASGQMLNDGLKIPEIQAELRRMFPKPQTEQENRAIENVGFRRWFKGSVVVDNAGEPLILYHGTNQSFNTFSPALSREGDELVFLSPNKKLASDFAMYRSTWEGANVMPVYVKADRILEVEGNRQPIRKAENETRLPGMQSDESLRDFAKREGYDGIAFKNVMDDVGIDIPSVSDVYAFFPSAQIKSAIGNSGDYDAANPDIRFSRGASTQTSALETDDPHSGLFVRDAETFSRWFGNSKVIREDGLPLKVYRGARFDWETGVWGGSDPSPQSKVGEWWFSSSPQVATGFADPDRPLDEAELFGMAPQTLSAYLALDNPLVVDCKGSTWATIQFEGHSVFTATLVTIAKERGHDGLVIKNLVEGSSPAVADTYVAFRRDQIKSAMGNSPAFSHSEAKIRYCRGFHGTPHQFDRFSLEAIGTGEGAAGYGWGLYFSERREVAEYYRDTLARPESPDTISGWDVNGASAVARDLLKDLPMDQAIEYARKREGRMRGLYDGVADQLDRIRQRGQSDTGNHLYEVEIPGADDLLDWDRPLSEQPARVYRAIRNAGIVELMGNEPFSVSAQMITGVEFYDQLTAFLKDRPLVIQGHENAQHRLASIQTLEGAKREALASGGSLINLQGAVGAQAASQYLNCLGIPGLCYQDQLSREFSGKESHNFVIWDDSLVTIHAVNEERRQADQILPPTQTSEFKSWFARSTVVTEAGEPRILFHATDNEFTVFDENKGAGLAGNGIYLSERSSLASDYGKTVMPLFASIKNPADFTAGEDAINKLARKMGLKRLSDLTSIDEMREWSQTFRQNMLDQGFDGARLAGADGETYHVAYEANQVKSATNNVGTFDAHSTDIRFRREGDHVQVDSVQDMENSVPVLMQQVQQAYETSDFLLAESLDQKLEELMDRLEHALADMEEDGLTEDMFDLSERHVRNAMYKKFTGTSEDSENSLEQCLAGTYADLINPHHYMDEEIALVNARANIELFGGSARDASDQQMLAVLKDVYENTGSNRARNRQAPQSFGKPVESVFDDDDPDEALSMSC